MENNPDDDGDRPGNISLVTREQCRLLSPTKYIGDLLVSPPEFVIISHTVTDTCSDIRECCTLIRNIQAFQINALDDIGYHFLIGGDGKVYEGRKWYKYGAHTFGYNCMSFGISFVGNFVNKIPTERQTRAAVKLLDGLVKNGLLSANYTLYAQSQVSNTESPGKELAGIVSHWAHWRKDVQDENLCVKISKMQNSQMTTTPNI